MVANRYGQKKRFFADELSRAAAHAAAVGARRHRSRTTSRSNAGTGAGLRCRLRGRCSLRLATTEDKSGYRHHPQ